MAVEVTIRQTGLFKKRLNVDDFTMNKFAYGYLDEGFILEMDEVSDEGFLLYNPEAIARGIDVFYPKGEKEFINLRLNLFTTDDEIEDFFNLIIELCYKCKTDVFLYENEECSLDDIPVLLDDLKNVSYNALLDHIKDTESGSLLIFGAYNPICIDKNELMSINANTSSDALKKYLHDLQSQDLYYAKPIIFCDNNDYRGIYIITEECDSVLPLDFKTSLDIINLFMDEPIILDKWIVGLYSITNDKIAGYVDFDSFKNFLEFDKLKKYDAETIILDGLSNAEIEQIVKNCITVDVDV